MLAFSQKIAKLVPQSLSSTPKILKRNMQIRSIPMRWGTGDNYAYLLTDDATKNSWVIDPAEPDEVLPVLKRLEKNGDINLVAIVNTHHHYDHAGGNEDMLASYPGLPVIAGKESPLVSLTPAHESKLSLGKNIEITALHTPCHTQDSICYYAVDKISNQGVVFTGDTLFNAGCGRFFEGTAKEMDIALNKVLGSLPNSTYVYPGHEYTKSNLKFVETVMDKTKNDALAKIVDYVKHHEKTTGVFTIGDEKRYNPFMMLEDKDIQEVTESEDRAQVMAKLRELKNKM